MSLQDRRHLIGDDKTPFLQLLRMAAACVLTGIERQRPIFRSDALHPYGVSISYNDIDDTRFPTLTHMPTS